MGRSRGFHFFPDGKYADGMSALGFSVDPEKLFAIGGPGRGVSISPQEMKNGSSAILIRTN